MYILYVYILELVLFYTLIYWDLFNSFIVSISFFIAYKSSRS